jgi:hypothetical protein
VFMVVPTSDVEKVRSAVNQHFLGLAYELPRGEQLVPFTGTSKQLSDRLGISDGSTGAAVVVSLGGYFGYAPNDIWEWFKQNWGGAPNG